ncbi:hypothetical protein C5G87_18915 [Paenibacillus peoriae]|uniref:hypothetical protein n=1 Tax=Paenibacillus peoriae TaxID=59893 RepID=UPI000CEBC0ED|nr:hypothetical protein [Paenibacillus peoriae]PPQ47383.1 hypothetical protein C5G87_18915 [Paenibacillus peoriae]
MTNNDYKIQVEKEHGKTLKEIMYELCVERDHIPAEISSILNVPKSTIIQWRNQFRFGPLQRATDSSISRRKAVIDDYIDELNDVDLNRDFINKTHSLSGFKELIQRFLELEKYRRTIIGTSSMADMSVMIRIESLNEMLSYINDYDENKLYERYDREVKNLELYKDF